MADERLRFLEASARHYTTTAPSLSAHLIQQRAQVAEENGLPYDKFYPPKTCRACGTIVHKDAETEGSQGLGSMQDLKCSKCNRILAEPNIKNKASTRNKLMLSKALNTKRKSLSQNSGASLQESGLSSLSDPSTSTVKQRSKSSKRGGLQALVQRSKNRQGTGLRTNLDLMDLMKVD